MQSGFEIVVIGGGVIGLSCAWKLAQRGVKVAIYDRLTAGREASFAAGGMIAPACETLVHPWPCDEPESAKMRELCFVSRDTFPQFAAELLSLTGHDIELCLVGAPTKDWRKPGILYIPQLDPPQNGRIADEIRLNGTSRFLGEKEGIWFQNDGHVDNRKLVDALRAACVSAGVSIFENAPVRRFEIEGNHVRRVWFGEDESVEADQFLLCAGAWSAKFAGIPPEIVPPIVPLAGQMLQLRGERRLSHVVYSESCYLIPRRDGRLLVGATTENNGFTKRVSAGGIFDLLRHALELVPDLRDAPLESHWAGLRPLTPDGLPILGRSAVENLFFATGHARNGILLAPETARLLCEAMLDFATIDPAFSVERFAGMTG